MATVANLIGITDVKEYHRATEQLAEISRASAEVGKSVAPLLEAVRASQERLRPVLESMARVHSMPEMENLRRTVANAVARHREMMESSGLRETLAQLQDVRIQLAPQFAEALEQFRSPEIQRALQEFRKATTFTTPAQLAYRAAILKYPDLVDVGGRIRLPEPTPAPSDPEIAPDDAAGSSRMREAVFHIVLATVLHVVFQGGGDTHHHYHNPVIVSPTPNAPVRVEPHGKAQIIERVRPGASVIVLDGEDRWCPVWPVRDLEEGWIFRRHLVDNE